MNNKSFTKTKIATTLSVILGVTALPAFAAEDTPAQEKAAVAEQNKETEIIEVTGIRGSLVKSMDIKRGSNGVVDAISAEDMGKFPDTNLAESLQRITGVSIDRENGEGSKVTVRGFGPDYNLVTLNGRQMPTANINSTSASGSRSFDFANIASEGVSAVEVFKTGRASVATGGIGATIDLRTIRPLDLGGFQSSVAVKAMHDTSSTTGDTFTPEVAALYSNTFADNTFGIAINGSYQNRQSGTARAGIDNGWMPETGSAEQNNDWGAVNPGPTQINVPGDGVTYAVPHNVLYGFSEVERTRTNGQVTMQYRPVESLTATLDYTYAKNEQELNQNISSVWMSLNYAGLPNGSQWTDANSENVAAPMYIHDVDGPADLVSQVEQSAKVNENISLGFNLEYLVNDNLSFDFDYHTSSAESKPDSIYGNSNTIQMASWTRAETSVDFTSTFPVVDVTFPDGVVGLTPEDVMTTGTSFRNSYMKSEIDQMQLEGKYVFDNGVVESVEFGIGQSNVENRSAFAVAERPNWGGTGSPADIDDNLLEASQTTIIDRFDAMPGDKTGMLNAFYAPDFITMANLVSDLYADPSDPDAWPCGTQICAPSEYTTDMQTTEDTTSAFIQASLGFEIADLPVSMLIGFRYESTDVTATTLLPDLNSLTWVSENEFAINRGDNLYYSDEGSYDYFLPNIDANIELTEDLILRAAYSETLTRPGYGNLTAGYSLNEVRTNGIANGSQGNTSLKPVESQNIDLSLEYYYAEGSYVSLGLFQKDVDGVIGYETVTESPYDITHPASGPRFDDAQAQVVANGGNPNDSIAIRAKIEENNPNDPYIVPGTVGGSATAITGSSVAESSINEQVQVKFDKPINQGSNKVTGLEFAVQQLFGDSGFGTIVNFTIVDSDIAYNNADIDEGATPLLGVSNSANFVGFYEKYDWQVRIAYNWRDDFLSSLTDGQGTNPVYTQDYGQWDANVSYNFNDHLSVFAEAINLTDEISRQYGRHELMTVNIQQTGPRYNLGLRYKF